MSCGRWRPPPDRGGARRRRLHTALYLDHRAIVAWALNALIAYRGRRILGSDGGGGDARRRVQARRCPDHDRRSARVDSSPAHQVHCGRAGPSWARIFWTDCRRRGGRRHRRFVEHGARRPARRVRNFGDAVRASIELRAPYGRLNRRRLRSDRSRPCRSLRDVRQPSDVDLAPPSRCMAARI